MTATASTVFLAIYGESSPPLVASALRQPDAAAKASESTALPYFIAACGSVRLLLSSVKANALRASETLDACEPHRARVQPGFGPVQRRAAACEQRFRRVRAAAWRVSAAPCPVRAGRCPVQAAPWRVRVHPCPVSIAPWACVSRGLDACEMTLGACQISVGECHLMFIHRYLRLDTMGRSGADFPQTLGWPINPRPVALRRLQTHRFPQCCRGGQRPSRPKVCA